jgi:hypothetical protein
LNVGLHDADGTTFPNLALMKIAAWHKTRGDAVTRFMPLDAYDLVYSAKVFSWTAEDRYLPSTVIKGGTGYSLAAALPDEIEHTCPDYDFYGVNYSLGFLTRGCVRSCPWCVVPRKEGEIRAHADIEEFCRHRDVVLMDNNVLAHPHGIAQIEKMARLDLRVDFNQGLDARLINEAIAKRLAALRWLKPLRLACDHKSQMTEVARAVRLLRAAGVTPRAYSCYVLVKDVPDALDRVEFLRGLGVDPFAQPYREPGTSCLPEPVLRRFARWVNHKAIFKTVSWTDYLNNFRPKYTRCSPAKNETVLLHMV